MIGLLALAGWWLKTRERSRRSTADNKNTGAISHQSSILFSVCFFFVFLLYPGCCFTAFSTFICSSLDDGTRYLRRYPSLDCNDPFHAVMEGYASIMIGPAGDSNTQHFANAALTSCVCLCVVIWPFGVPLLYAVGFWWNWPEISRLRRAELRHKSTKALSKARRQSVGHQRLLEGNLVVTFGALDAGDKEDENAEPADEELLPAAGRFEVALKHRRLELLATDGSPLLQLELLAGSHARLGDDEKQLPVAGTFTPATDDAGGRRVQGPARELCAAAPIGFHRRRWALPRGWANEDTMCRFLRARNKSRYVRRVFVLAHKNASDWFSPIEGGLDRGPTDQASTAHASDQNRPAARRGIRSRIACTLMRRCSIERSDESKYERKTPPSSITRMPIAIACGS